MYTLVLFSSDLCDNGLYLGGLQVKSISELLSRYTYSFLLSCSTQQQLAKLGE